MYKKLLVPLDLTDSHGAVLETAADLAKLHDGDVTLLHVIEAIAGLSAEEANKFYGQLEASAKAHLERHSFSLREHGVRCCHKILIGNRAREIAEYAAAIGCDLILLTAPSYDPSHPVAGIASLSYKVSLLSQCPVLLVKLKRP
jgi:universal stress protein A